VSAPEVPPRSPLGDGAAGGGERAGQLARAAELVAARDFREAEVEVLRAIAGAPTDLRAMNLLALVRFKLGRLDEARATYREIAGFAPQDPAVRRNLGLLALKVERYDEAATELELAVRLAPADKRAWSYLGYAYARRGDVLAAAAAFRHGGQEAIAAEIEDGAPPPSGNQPAPPELGAPAPAAVTASPAPAHTLPHAGRAFQAPVSAAEVAVLSRGATGLASLAAAVGGPPVETRPVPVVSFVLAALGLAAEAGAPSAAAAGAGSGAPVRLSTRDGAHVRADAALAGRGAAPWETAFRRVRGRRSGDPLGSRSRPFYRLNGAGEVWVAGAANHWIALALQDDILYVREERVLAFDGAVTWESGRVPGDGLRMLQFRGRGQVVLQLGGAPSAIRVSDEAPALVSRTRLLGWVGRVVAHKCRQEGPLQLSCEGDGVMLFETRRSPAWRSAA
jgi:hypothetical protein